MKPHVSVCFAILLLLAASAAAQTPGQASGPTLPSPRPERLMARFSGTPRTGAIPLLVSFTDESLGGAQTWFWEFGDGGTSTLQNPSHTYTVVGFYTVKLTVTRGPFTHSLTRDDYVHAIDPPPIADFSATPLAGELPLLVTFTDLSSGGPRSGWSWDFGDGGTSTNQHPSHVYTQPGFYTVSLVASGPGGSDTETKASYIRVLAPVPAISIDLPSFLPQSKIVEFTVTVTDPNNDLVTAKLLNPPPGLVLEPILNQPSPATVKGRWIPLPLDEGIQQLVFEAFNATYPTEKARERIQVEVADYWLRNTLVVADVTGDDVLDTITCGVFREYLHVWAGKATPDGAPTARLLPPANFVFHTPVQIVDVTGDGVVDIVVAAYDASFNQSDSVLVYAGGPQLDGDVTFSARLRDPTTGLFVTRVFVAPLTGGPYPDVVAYSNETLIAIFKGGPTMTGTRSPDARLLPSSGGKFLESGTSLRCYTVDMTGDGQLDILAVQDNEGHVLIWQGGATLTGTPAPWADLTTSKTGEGLGHQGGNSFCCASNIPGSEGWWIADVDGDSTMDVIAAAWGRDTPTSKNVGAIYVWRDIVPGPQGPTALLAPNGTVETDEFFPSGAGPAVQFHDVTGDGVLDILACDVRGVGWHARDGRILVWAGGPSLVGTSPPETARLFDPSTDPNYWADHQGNASGQSFYLTDVTGDGSIDVVVVGATVGGISSNWWLDWGAVRIYAGPWFSGDVAPTAALEAGHQTGGLLGGAVEGHSVQLVDLNVDGVTDILTASYDWDLGSAVDAGAIFFWAGGPGLVGFPPPTATLTAASPLTGDRLGWADDAPISDGIRQSIMLGDVTGDGLRDIVAVAATSDVGGALDTGGLMVWEGGPSLSGVVTPTATLTLTGAHRAFVSFLSGQAILLADVTDDGILDVVSGTIYHDGSKIDSGAVMVWPGGPGLTGYQGSPLILNVPGTEVDRLGYAFSSQAIRLADVTGDGILDLIGVCSRADVGGVNETGALYLFRGPLNASAPPMQKLYVPGAPALYRLGEDQSF